MAINKSRSYEFTWIDCSRIFLYNDAKKKGKIKVSMSCQALGNRLQKFWAKVLYTRILMDSGKSGIR